ncbi:MAG: SPASM domain-containing protein, partial [Desulfovibrionaceae bacterium]|nr:SPASM domain-containing protein [Desulfovibrionaceae bacterium]
KKVTQYFRRPLPKSVRLELSNMCNCECFVCPLFHGQDKMDTAKRKPMTMDFDLFAKIIRQITTWPQYPQLYLNIFGEPLLDKGLPEKMVLLNRAGLSSNIYFNTNATLLTPDISRILLENRIGQIVPALDSANPRTYEFIRNGADFQTVFNNIISFAKLRDAINPATKICIQCVTTPLNRHDHEAVYSLLGEYLGENDTLSVTTAQNWARSSLDEMKVTLCPVESRQIHFQCEQLHDHLHILADGKATPCCYDYNLELCGSIGDANVDGIVKIWNNKKYTSLINKINTGKDLPILCKNCCLLFSDYTKFNFESYNYPVDKILPAHHGILVSFKK